ncbi:hypothetical protein [Streptomyces abyssomicinicus]|uniref:hypothetical protein n=1 Tax=Streptomyces abyssomicinicus TaxID=574929 RepID=UPI001FE7D01E|nr:hypothetical protein [Streptomyces abyssomicinicus]
MQQHADDGAGHRTDAAEDPELYDDEIDDDGAEPFGHEEAREGTVVQGGDAAQGRPAQEGSPDVFLDVPQLKVDEIDLDVENLRARVSLQAEVLDLLKLNVGADVALGQVHLGISGVEAQAQLKVRLDNVALIINRVLTTLDRNPRIIEDLVRNVGSAVGDVGRGAGSAVEVIGGGAGEAVGDLGQGVGELVEDVGGSAGEAVGEVGGAAGEATRTAGATAGSATRSGGGRSRTPSAGRAPARKPARRTANGANDGRPETGRRRKRDDASEATRPTGRRAAKERGEPP